MDPIPNPGTTAVWPDIPFGAWRETCAGLHLYTQIVGKYRLARTPWVNHSWHATLYVNARGLTSSLVPDGSGGIELELDLIDHVVIGTATDGRVARFAMGPMSVADFHEQLLDLIRALTLFFRALVQIDRVLKRFSTGYLGKASPVHLFWGSFDMAVTRFSGRRAPPHPGGIPALPDEVTREAYSHEVSSAGFWPGGGAIDYPAFYSYAYPAPAGFAQARAFPGEAYYSSELSEFVLPYDAVRQARDPEATLLAFLQSTYNAAADLGAWDRAALECIVGEPRRPRPL